MRSDGSSLSMSPFGLAVVCCTDFELAWLFGRRNYRPDKPTISAWSGVQTVGSGIWFGLESVGWAKIVVG